MIKLLKITPFYSQVIERCYNNDKELAYKDYNTQYDQIMSSLFGWADFWKLNLDKLNLFETIEIISNSKQLQTTWAKENQIEYSEENWLLDIIESQIKFYQPDILFAHDYWHITNDFLKRIKKEVSSIKLVMGWDGLLYNDINFYKEWDLILSPSQECANYYQNNGKLGYYFTFGFEKTILDKIQVNETKKYNTSFVGSVILEKNYHLNRFNLLGYVSGKIDLDLWASSFFQKNQIHQWQPYRYPQRQRLKQGKWKEWLYIWRLSRINKGELFGKDMYQALSDSKITINNHIDLAGNNAVNIRLYEATGIGSCLVTDWKDNIVNIFKPDEEIIVYKSPQECVDKIKYLLKNEKERKKIAQAGQKKTLENYSFEKRIKDFVTFLLQNYNVK
jgi:glycosyltransferase involved in cell wall biosynthesis